MLKHHRKDKPCCHNDSDRRSTYCNVDGQSHARPDRDMPVAAQPLGCDVTQQEGEVRSVTRMGRHRGVFDVRRLF
jgi:hypothetical protein